MTDSYRAPARLYLVINGIEKPIRPRVALIGQSKFDVRRYTQNSANNEVELDDSRVINRISYELQQARSDRYSLLARSQPLVKSNKVTVDVMREALHRFDSDVWERYWLWAEMMDSQPHLRGFKLPKGKNAFLYIGSWKVKEDYDIVVSTMDPKRDLVAVAVPTKNDSTSPMSQKWKDITGITDTFNDAYHEPVDLDFAKINLKGLNTLLWGFGDKKWPRLSSSGRPGSKGPTVGTLLGSKLNMEEIVECF